VPDNNIVRVGDVEIMQLSDGMLEFDLCNFFPTIPGEEWKPYESHLTHEHKVRFNLGSYLIRSSGRTILVDTGLGPRPADTPDVPWGELLRDFQAKGVRPEEVDTSQGQRALVLGDAAHSPAQVEEPDWVSRADMDPDLTRQTRRALLDRLEREEILVAAGHFESPGFGRIVRLNGRRYWRGL
jgi:glyoxylase-like metal-dependent hydrolase (beta-lactamase superfamily II)